MTLALSVSEKLREKVVRLNFKFMYLGINGVHEFLTAVASLIAEWGLSGMWASVVAAQKL